jgi:hypothetical protein
MLDDPFEQYAYGPAKAVHREVVGVISGGAGPPQRPVGGKVVHVPQPPSRDPSTSSP